MQVKFNTKKSGVSLIVVLMFMMIATIAATATWKWLSSEGRSSSSRMLKREAYQSAMAGIENARAWMTYHSNDVGAIIRQYIDGGNKPINLDSRLRALQRAGQNFHVWLTGVNVENATYKLKIYSAGESRNGTKHNEVAIFNVDGLYRINIPKEGTTKANDFDYNYFGSTTVNHGDIFVRSILVNGDLTGGNPATVDSNMIVTGNFKVSGNSVAVHGTACVGGNLDADNGIVGNNFYVHGNLDNLNIRAVTANKGGQTINLGNSIYGNLYVNGNISAANGNQVIDGNLTLNGKWTTNMSGYNAGVRGDMCLGSGAQIYFPNMDREFKATGNVWMESDYPLWVSTTSGWGWWSTSSDDNYSKYNRINLGTKGKKVYIKTGHPWSDYNELYNTYSFDEDDGKQFGCEGAACNGPAHKWTGNTNVKVFTKRDSKPNLYYLYNWNSSDLVTFDNNYYDDYWKKYLAVYKVDGHRFWDTYNSAYTLNYSNNRATGSPYCYQGSGDHRAKARPICSVTPWFKVDGDFKTPFPGTRPADLTCAESVKSHCDSIWEKTDGCASTKFLVTDPLKTGITFFESYANKSSCVRNLVNNVDFNNFDFSQFNTCYTQALEHDEKSDDKLLYNKYLVVKITNRNIFTSSKGFLTGKFIFIFENDMHQNMKIPPTVGDGSYLFMYLKDGLSGEILPGDNVSELNFFIYTKNDINTVLFNQTIMKGSIYAAVHDEETGSKTCAKVNNLTFNRGMEFNQQMVDDLTDAGVLCKNDGSSCGGINNGTVTEDDTDESTEDAEKGKDRFFISTAPQLSISVESMYETQESQPVAGNTVDLQPAYVILPRVIYLPSDPYGELKDYYNVLALNGASLKKEDVVYSIACNGPGSLSTTGKLFNGTALTRGLYKCEATPSEYDNVPFWVVVGSASRGDGEVSFEKPYQSLLVSQTTPVPVNILVSPHATELSVKVNCPALPGPEWRYDKNAELLDNTASDGCTFKIPPNNENGVYKLFEVTTTNATSGRLTFTLRPGEGYTLASPYYTDLQVSSTADINRADLDQSEISSYCAAHSNVCPSGGYDYWPNCSYTGLWVEPEGGATAVVTDDLNNSWTISTGGSAGTIELKDRSNGRCVVLIPDGSDNKLDKSSMEPGMTYTLKASAKALARTLRIVFVGDIDAGDTPVINYETASTTGGQCVYTGTGIGKACSIPVFDGEDISLSIDSTNLNNKDFSYWLCSGASCPSTDPLHSSKYDAFNVNDNATVMYVHFGESDKHCFDELFKNKSVACTSSDVEYCIDKCDVADDAICVGAVDSRGTYTKAKWHLLSGKLSDIENNTQYISLKNLRKKTRGVNNRNTQVKVISTVTAGINGTMKAMFRMPQATSSYGRSSENIANSGFMLRSNAAGTEYLMLNVFVNTKGRLEAQLCTDAGSCLNGELAKDGSTKSVTTASMVVLSATLNTQNQLVVSAFTGENYYGSPDEYSYTFGLSGLTTNYSDRAHEYVGFSLADPNFRLYGIGWQSEDYKSECWDTPPTVKCSFAAKAQNGVIELDKEVVPWVGHSGWFDSKECTPSYYYYNGNDASCGNADANGLECYLKHYKFTTNGKGLHGYGNDVKTAKASLTCISVDGVENMWNLSAGRAHCGTFWTGEFTECSENYSDLLGTNKDMVLEPLNENLTEIVIAQGSRYNLRGASLNVTLENSDHNEVEIVLVSKHDYNSDYAGFNLNTIWGDYKGNTIWGSANDGNGIFMSNSVKMTGNTASFDVVEEFAKGAEGFDPENVRSIILRNHGTSSVTVKFITTSCRNAVSVSSCKAEYKEDNLNAWVVSARINNISSATDLTLNKKVESGTGTNYKCGDTGVNCARENGVVTYTIPDNPYIHQGEHYYFKMSVSNGNKTDEKDCEVTPDPIGAISSTCSVNPLSVQTGKGMPQFQFSLFGCPESGCKYKIMQGEKSETGTAKSGIQVKKTISDLNTETNALPEGEYVYRVVPDGSETPFTECSASFNVTKQVSEDEEVATTCSIEGANNGAISAGGQAKFTFVVNNNQGINISGRNYRLELSDGTVLSGNTGSNYSNQVWFTVPATSGDVTLKVWDKTEYKVSCTQSLTVSAASVTCGVSKIYWGISGESTFYTTEDLYFMAKNNESVAGTIDVTVTKNGSADGTGTITSYGNWSSVKNIGTLGVGDYTYSIKSGGAELCKHSISIVEPLSCSVDKTTVGLGESFTMSTTYAGTCWNSSLSGSPSSGNGLSGPSQCQSSYTITPSSTGKFEYTYSVTNGSLGNVSCKKSVTVSEIKPKIVCPDDKTAKVGSTVYVTPKSLIGCGTGCSYTIEGAGASEASGYTGGAVSFTGASKAGDKDYTFHVTNSKGDDKCDFTVTYTESASGCNCTCSTGCDNLYTGSSVEGGQSTKYCLFATTITEINEFFNKNPIMVNGIRPGYCSNGDSYSGNHCTNKLATLEKVDGGYYIETPITSGDSAWFRITVDGSRTPNCGGGSSSGSCHCEQYCGSGCENNIRTGNVNGETFTGCVFFTSALRINVVPNHPWQINGWHEDIKPSDNGCYNTSEADCESFLSSKVSKVDGGYYFYSNGAWAEIYSSGTNPCSGN